MLKPLPIVIFTKDRTACAMAVVNSILDNLRCTGYEPRYIVSDDMSVPGHLEAVVKVFTSRDITPTVCRTSPAKHGLGASMNNGLAAAFSDPAVNLCLRMEDDWLLKYPLDLGLYLDLIPKFQIGSLRMGMMFREPGELSLFPSSPEAPAIFKVLSRKDRIFTFNNQLAVISRDMYELVGRYPENVRPYLVERYGMDTWNKATEHGRKPPFVAWPAGWKTMRQYDPSLPFAHIGVSVSGHAGLYQIPKEFIGYNDSGKDAALRSAALASA